MATIVSVYECENLIKNLKVFNINKIGYKEWTNQHLILEKLNMQAHHNAQTKHDEFVLNYLIQYDKISILINNLLIINVWKRQIYPLIANKIDNIQSVKVYMLLYHEAIIMNLLELVFYHEDAMRLEDDQVCDLIDYCYERICQLNTNMNNDNNNEKNIKKLIDETQVETLKRQYNDIEFACSTAAISIFRYLTDHINILPMAAIRRILDTHDCVLCCVYLLKNEPWRRYNHENQMEIYKHNKWQICPPRDRFVLVPLEAQTWLIVYNLLMDRICRARYEFNTHRKEVIIQLRGKFNDVLKDQLPLLNELHRFIEELNVMLPPPPTESNFLVLEQVSILKEQLENINYQEIANDALNNIFVNDENYRQDIVNWASTYDIDGLEEVLEIPTCAKIDCEQSATKRCSRCKKVWYCSRQCQVYHWKIHKDKCIT